MDRTMWVASVCLYPPLLPRAPEDSSVGAVPGTALCPAAGKAGYREGTLTACSKCPKAPGFAAFRLSTSMQIITHWQDPFC